MAPARFLCGEWGVAIRPAEGRRRLMLVVSINKEPIEKCGEVLCAVFRQGFFCSPRKCQSVWAIVRRPFFPFSCMEKRKESKERHAIDGQVGHRKRRPATRRERKREYRIKKSELGGASSSS